MPVIHVHLEQGNIPFAKGEMEKARVPFIAVSAHYTWGYSEKGSHLI